MPDLTVPGANFALLQSIDDIERAAAWMVESQLFGVQNKAQAIALMLIAQAEGIPAVLAVRDYHIIEGRPALKAETMLARHLQSGGSVAWKERTELAAEATFSHPMGGTVTVRWDLDAARRAGLADKPNWKKYPRAQLHARCVSEGCRAVNPQATGHVYTPEEVRDMRPGSVIEGEVEQSSLSERLAAKASQQEQQAPPPAPASWADELANCATAGDVRSWYKMKTKNGDTCTSVQHAAILSLCKARVAEIEAAAEGDETQEVVV